MPHVIPDAEPDYQVKMWHEMNFSEMTNWWFDRLVESKDPAKAEILTIAQKHATSANVKRMREVVTKIEDVRLRNAIQTHLDTLKNFKPEFKRIYAYYPAWRGQCTAASELFSMLKQAVTYND